MTEDGAPQNRKEAIELVLTAFNIAALERVNTPVMETMFVALDALRLLGASDEEITEAMSGLALRLS